MDRWIASPTLSNTPVLLRFGLIDVAIQKQQAQAIRYVVAIDRLQLTGAHEPPITEIAEDRAIAFGEYQRRFRFVALIPFTRGLGDKGRHAFNIPNACRNG